MEFHFIGDEPLDTTGLPYCAAHCYDFRNKSQTGEYQHSQILSDGESLELIADPGNREEKLFYGWYVVNPYVTSETTNYGLIVSDHLLYYTWPATPVSVTFESPISIEESNVQIGDTVHWSINGVSGSGTVDSDGNVHVLLAPVFEKYNFIINVVDTLGSGANIGVYDASGNGDEEGGHNRAGEPFGTRVTGITGDFSKFVNDRNGLHGMQSGDDPDVLVIWEAVTLTVSKSVTGGTSAQTQDFTFTLTVASDETAPVSYTILKTNQENTTTSGSIVSGGTFTLKHNETALIK